MSLTSILRSSDQKDKEIKEVIKSVAPKKSDFKTYSGVLPFSNYQVISENKLINAYDSGLVGTAFDYLAQIVCACYTNTKLNENEFEQLLIDNFLGKKENKDVLTLYKKTQDKIDFLINNNSKCTSAFDEELLSGVFVMAKLENLWRSGFLIAATKEDVLKPVGEDVRDDVASLVQNYTDVFFKSDLVKPDSLITYNPTFSSAVGLALGGIDADICIDETLYDFKSTKKVGFAISDSMQITAYYLFYLLDRLMSVDLKFQRHKIKRIALYKARFGQVEYFDVENILKADLINALSELNRIFKLGVSDKEIRNFEF